MPMKLGKDKKSATIATIATVATVRIPPISRFKKIFYIYIYKYKGILSIEINANKL